MADNIWDKLGRLTDAELIEPLREGQIARELLYVDRRTSDYGVSNVNSYKYADMAGGHIDDRPPGSEVVRDRVESTEVNTPSRYLWEAFEIPRDEFEAFKKEGIMIDTATAMSAMDAVLVQESELILNGWTKDNGTTYIDNGFMQGNGQQEATSKDFGTYGNALDKVSLGMALLDNVGVKPRAYNLTLNPTQMAELRSSKSTVGVKEYEQVIDMLNPNGGMVGQIRSHSDISADYGLLTPVDPAGKYFRLFETYAPRTLYNPAPGVPEEIAPIQGIFIEKVGMNIRQSNAIVKLANI